MTSTLQTKKRVYWSLWHDTELQLVTEREF